MKLIPYVKKGLILFIKDIRMMAISFLILPMALALIYGNMQKDLFEGKVQPMKAIKVDFKYDESSIKGRIFKGILSQKELGEFIQQSSEGANYTVTIDDGFKSVKIQGKNQDDEQFIVLNNFLETVINSFNQNDVMQGRLDSLNISDSKKVELANNVMQALERNRESTVISEKIVSGYKTLGSVEYFTISMFSFTSMILIITLAGYYYKEVKDGIVKRSLSTPNNRVHYFLGFVVTAFIVTLAITLLYVLINRIRGIAFLGNPLAILIVLLLQSILSASVVGMVIAFIKKEVTANVLMNLIFVLSSMLGGVFFYIDVIGSKVLQKIMSSVPNSLILNSYKSLAITGSLGAAQGELIVMAVLSAVFLTTALVKVQIKWEV